MKLRIKVNKGGPGSGHHDHVGRPGKVGGSLPSTSSYDLSSNQISALKSYRALDFGNINRYLRGMQDASSDVKKRIPLIDSAMKKFQLKEDKKLYRRERNLEHFGDLKVGDVFTEPAYWSTTDELTYIELPKRPPLDVAGFHIGAFTINVPKGIHVIPMNEVLEIDSNEDEWLMERGLSFKVTNIRRSDENSTIYYDLDVVSSTEMKGGPGSGHHDHVGRPGKVGGSLPDDASKHSAVYVMSDRYSRNLDDDLISSLDEDVGPWIASSAIHQLSEDNPSKWGRTEEKFKIYAKHSMEWVRAADFNAKASAVRMLKNNPDVRTLSLFEMYYDYASDKDFENFISFRAWLNSSDKKSFYRIGSLHPEGVTSFTHSEAIARDAANAYEGEKTLKVMLAPSDILGFSMSGNGEIYVEASKLVPLEYKGGPGSGHHGHRGRPGKVGGSLPDSAIRRREGPTYIEDPTSEQLEALGLPGESKFTVSTETFAQAVAEDRYDISVSFLEDYYGWGDEKRYDVDIKYKIPDDWEAVQHGRKTIHYDPKYAEITEIDKFNDGIQYVNIQPKEKYATNIEEIVEETEGKLFRGMRAEEIESALREGSFETLGDYNIGESQEGLTFFSTQPEQAESYASGFAPWSSSPTPDRPAFIIEIDNLENYEVTVGDTEVGVPGKVPIGRVTNLYVGIPYRVSPGSMELIERGGVIDEGSRSSPTSSVVWQKLPVSVLKDVQKELLVEKQLPIDDESKAELMKLRRNLFFDEVEDLAEQVYTGEISIGQWEETMKQEIRQLHTSMAAIGAGGWDEMTSQMWGRLGTPLREQYRFLHGFAEYISENRDVVSLAMLKSRARLYGKAGGYSVSLMQAGAIIESQLPFIPRDGSTECLVGCHCMWLLDKIGEDSAGQKVQAVWLTQPAEHCQDCLDREGLMVVVNVPHGMRIPPKIGGF